MPYSQQVCPHDSSGCFHSFIAAVLSSLWCRDACFPEWCSRNAPSIRFPLSFPYYYPGNDRGGQLPCVFMELRYIFLPSQPNLWWILQDMLHYSVEDKIMHSSVEPGDRGFHESVKQFCSACTQFRPKNCELFLLVCSNFKSRSKLSCLGFSAT